MMTRIFLPKGEMDQELLVSLSIIGPIGLPAQQALYPPVPAVDGKPMNAMHDYVIRMDANALPPANAFWSVTPGLIDAHTVVGLSGHLNQPHDQDQLDLSELMQPELRATDAFNPAERADLEVLPTRTAGCSIVHSIRALHQPPALHFLQRGIETAGAQRDRTLTLTFDLLDDGIAMRRPLAESEQDFEHMWRKG